MNIKKISITLFCVSLIALWKFYLCAPVFVEGEPFDTHKAKAEAGHSVAQLSLGHRYRVGDGVAQNSDLAIMWYKKSAENGHKDAQTVLGISYLYGDCVAKDAQKSFEYFLCAAKNGDASGQNNVGVSYLTGEGVEKNNTLAVQYFMQSAEQGWSEAQFNLGVCYAKGIGVEKDLVQSKMWFQKAQKRGVHQELCPHVEMRCKLFLDNVDAAGDDIWVRQWVRITFHGFSPSRAPSAKSLSNI